MPTKRARWPDGAEGARRDAVAATRTIVTRARPQRDLLDTTIRRLAGKIPECDMDALRTARDALADIIGEAEFAHRRLTEGRYGVPEDET